MVGINSINGLIAGFSIQIVPASRRILNDGSGNVLPPTPVAPGGTSTLFFTGAGDVVPQIFSGFAPDSSTAVACDLPVFHSVARGSDGGRSSGVLYNLVSLVFRLKHWWEWSS